MKRRQLITIISYITAAIGLLLILIVGWNYSKQYRMRTYKDPQGFFRLKYPADWGLMENVNGAAVVLYTPLENDLDFFQENINVAIQQVGPDRNIKEYAQVAIDQLTAVFETNVVMIESQPIYLNDLPAHQIIFLGKGPQATLKYKIIIALKGQTAILLTYTAIESTYDTYIGKVDRVFRSFKEK